MTLKDQFVSPLIAAAGAVAGALITTILPYILNKIDQRRRYDLPKGFKFIEGTWIGGGSDFFTEDGTPFDNFTLKINFRTSGNRVTGLGELNDTPALLELEGGFQSDAYLQFAYRSADPSRRQMGVIMFRISADGRSLRGYYAGFSPTREIFLVGNVSLRKQALRES